MFASASSPPNTTPSVTTYSLRRRLLGKLARTLAAFHNPASSESHCRSHLIHTYMSAMPLHTCTYSCGHSRRYQGRECSCFNDQILRINDRSQFSSAYLPFSSCGGCKHDKTYYKRYDCSDCVYQKSRGESRYGDSHRWAYGKEYRERTSVWKWVGRGGWS